MYSLQAKILVRLKVALGLALFITLVELTLHSNRLVGGSTPRREKHRQLLTQHFSDLFQSIHREKKPKLVALKDQNTTISQKSIQASQKEGFMLRLSSTIGFSLPAFSSVELVPETEFYWEVVP